MQEDNALAADIASLKSKVQNSKIPSELEFKIQSMLDRLTRQSKFGGYTSEYESVSHYIDWATSLPWDKTTKDILDLDHAKKVLDINHYGLDDVKNRFLEYLSVLILNQQNSKSDYHAPVLLLVGLVGTGKTTLAISLAEALGRKLIRIPFGGMSSALDLRGQSRSHPEAEPGQIIKNVRRVESRNPVILLDEIDRVAESARGEIMGVLVELLDPKQNQSFSDYYMDYPLDLSQAIFIATSNNTANISTAVLDRLEIITMPSYTDEEKINIAQKYILPREIINAAIPQDHLKFEDNVWPKITRPLGFDAGIRTLERTIQGIVRKVARKIVEGNNNQISLNADNVKEYLPTY